MKRLQTMKECLINCTMGQISNNLSQVDTKELGEAIDMIKDLEEAIYYATITEAMEEKYDDKEERAYRTPMYRQGMSGYTDERMYTTGHHGTSGSHLTRDMREGSSPMYRKMYMEGKEMHHDKGKQMKELESYMQELSADIIEMIQDASPEEKQLLQQKISVLATKIK